MLRDWLNKKAKKAPLVIDEGGTIGTRDHYLGTVVVLTHDVGRVDKCLSDLLEPGTGEIHVSRLDNGYLQSLTQCFWAAGPPQ